MSHYHPCDAKACEWADTAPHIEAASLRKAADDLDTAVRDVLGSSAWGGLDRITGANDVATWLRRRADEMEVEHADRG